MLGWSGKHSSGKRRAVRRRDGGEAMGAFREEEELKVDLRLSNLTAGAS